MLHPARRARPQWRRPWRAAVRKSSPTLIPGDAFLYRRHKRGHIWNRSFGGAKVLARDDELGVIHIHLLPTDDQGNMVRHLPIMLSRLLEDYSDPVESEKPEWRETTYAWGSIISWREAVKRGEASAFDVRISQAEDLIRKAWLDLSENPESPVNLASAYPSIDAAGAFSKITLIYFDDQPPAR